MKMEVSKDFSFEAAHSLPHLPEGHKCRNKHGHSYRIRVCCCGDVDSRFGWVVDYADIAAAVDPVIAMLDHHDLDAFLSPSTAEKLSAFLWECVKPKLPSLFYVEVYETASTCVRYLGE